MVHWENLFFKDTWSQVIQTIMILKHFFLIMMRYDRWYDVYCIDLDRCYWRGFTEYAGFWTLMMQRHWETPWTSNRVRECDIGVWLFYCDFSTLIRWYDADMSDMIVYDAGWWYLADQTHIWSKGATHDYQRGWGRGVDNSPATAY